MADPELAASERLGIQEEALRFAQVGFYRYRFDGTVLDMDEVAFDILGLRGRFGSPADIVGRNIEELLVYVGPRQRVRDLVREHGEARNLLYPFRTLDGEEKWAVHDSFQSTDATGEVVVQAIVKDVTALYRTQEALRQSEERLARLVETVPEGIVIVGRDGRITFANPAAEVVLGLTREAIVERTYDDPAWQITTVGGRPFAAEELPVPRVLRTGEPVHGVEHAVVRPDGTRVILSVNAAPLRDPAGMVVGVVASLTDVTERQRVEAERRRTLAREQALSRIGLALVSELGLDRVADTVIEQSLSVLGADTAGLWLADPAHRVLDLLAHRSARPETFEVLGHLSYDAPFVTAQAARTEQVQVVEDLLAGEMPPLARQVYEREGVRSLLAVPLRSRGRLVGVLTHLTRTPRRFTASDVEFNTTLANLFAVAIDNARLFEQVRDALRVREEFMSAAAHELKTPVTTIKGWTGFLLKADHPEGRERMVLETIDHQTDRITHLVEDLLAVVRLRDTPPELSRERFDLGALIRSLVTRTAQTIEQPRFHVSAGRGLVVEADRELVRNVLSHLLENALRYAPSDAEIDVEARRVGGEAVVSVRNPGPGIPPERQPHVFEPFYEALPSGHPGYVGSVSLGLALARQIVEAHGGRIWVESEVGKGATFTFSLPLAQ